MQLRSAVAVAVVMCATTAAGFGRPFASGEYHPGSTLWDYGPHRAFDSNLKTRWISEPWKPAYIGIDYGRDVRVAAYQLFHKDGNLLSRAPRTWEVQGSRDNGATWDVLDRQSGVSIEDWRSMQVIGKVVALKSVASYPMYRVEFFEDNDGRAPIVVISLAEVSFIPPAP